MDVNKEITPLESFTLFTPTVRVEKLQQCYQCKTLREVEAILGGNVINTINKKAAYGARNLTYLGETLVCIPTGKLRFYICRNGLLVTPSKFNVNCKGRFLVILTNEIQGGV